MDNHAVKGREFRVLFVYPNLMLQTTFPLAFAIFSAILKERGYRVEIFDTTFYRTEDTSSDERRVENLQLARFTLGKEFDDLPDRAQMLRDLADKVASYRPHLIAYSILEDLYPLALELLDVTKRFGIPTIAGGLFPTFAPEIVLGNEGIDMVCVGEGEETLPELCDSLSEGKSFGGIRNLWVKDGGRIVRNGLRPPRNLDLNPPPDFSLFDDRRFYRPMKGQVYRMGLVETNRGCPFTCSFCNSHAQTELYRANAGCSYFRTKDIGRVHDEIKVLVQRHKVQFLYFPAEVFLAMSRSELKEMEAMYRRFRLPFFCQNRAEMIDDERAGILESMNCHGCAIGVEHGNEEFRYRVLNRKVSNRTYIDAMQALAKTNIKVSVNNIVGFPDETRELAFDTIRLNRQFEAYQVNAYFYTPYHGTALRQRCVEKGYIAENAQTSYITKGTILRMPAFPPDEIHGLVRTFTLYVRFPESRHDEIRRAEKFDDEGNRLFEGLKREYWDKFLK